MINLRPYFEKKTRKSQQVTYELSKNLNIYSFLYIWKQIFIVQTTSGIGINFYNLKKVYKDNVTKNEILYTLKIFVTL